MWKGLIDSNCNKQLFFAFNIMNCFNLEYMKKLLYVLGGLVLGASLTVFAASVDFVDKASFAPWFVDAVARMASVGVIKGYPDGTFKPYDNVKRAELAVMLDRFYDNSNNKLQRVIREYDKLTNAGFDYKIYLVMAESGLKMLSSAPSLDYLKLVKDAKLPDGYTIYSKSAGPLLRYYLHYVGFRRHGDLMYQEDSWYGPFGGEE